jgi:post-segregation antitoxin (ccd killing protein)
VRCSITLDAELADRARQLNIDIAAAAREGMAAAVRAALAAADRVAYESHPERSDSSWDEPETWGDE